MRKRRQIFVDPPIQGSLIVRTLMYWMFCLLTIATLLLCWRMITDPGQTVFEQLEQLWIQFAPAMLVSLFLVPVAIVDMVRFSNRFCGPMIRLRNAMRRLADGEAVEQITLRKGDFWQNFADEFNRLSQKVQAQRDHALLEESDATEATTECDTEELVSSSTF